jgi:hypothetical protein
MGTKYKLCLVSKAGKEIKAVHSFAWNRHSIARDIMIPRGMHVII